MSVIQQLISDITAFMAGNNRTFTPGLKKMYDSYREQCAELADLLAQCRALMQKGMTADARALNLREKPPLTERFAILNFPERQAFIDLCVDYGLPPMPAWDEEVVKELQGPISVSDAQIATLMQQWRRIARTGTPEQRVQILRKIVAGTPSNNNAWKRNLAEAEKARYAEIREQLPMLAGSEDELRRLESISTELFSPAQLTPPPEDLVRSFKEQLLPLQRKHLATEIDNVLDEIQFCYEAHDVKGIKAAYQKWKRLASNPLSEIRPGQEQTIQDAMTFVAKVEQSEADDVRFQQLLRNLEELLEKDAKFSELAPVYETLQLMERELPQALVDQMRIREEDARDAEHRLHVRRCVYGVSSAVVLLLLTYAVIQLMMYNNSVRQTCRELDRQKTEGLFEEGMELYEKLKKNSPRVASNSQVLAKHAELIQAKEKRDAKTVESRNEFNQIILTIENFDREKQYDSGDLDELMKQAEALRDWLTDEQRQQLVKIRESVFATKEKIQNNRKVNFLAECEAFQREVAELQKRIPEHHEIPLNEHKAALGELKRREEQILANDKIDPSIKVSNKNLMDKLLDSINALISEEEKYRLFSSKLESPHSLDEYLSTIERLPDAPEVLRDAYARASAHYDLWNIEDREREQPAKSFEKYMEKDDDGKTDVQSIFRAEFSLGYKFSDKDPIHEMLKDSLAKCDLYELVFLDMERHPFFFYANDEPMLEWSKTMAGMPNFIILNGKESSKEEMLFFKCLKNKNMFQYGTVSGKNTMDVPETCSSLIGWNNAKPEFAKCKFTKMLAWIPDANEMTPIFKREQIAWNLLEFCLVLSDSNPSLKAQLLRIILQALCVYEPDFYRTRLKALDNVLAEMPTDWKQPSIATKNQEAVSKMEETLAAFNWKEIRAHREFQIAFVTALWKHLLVPLGVLTVKGEQLGMATFDGKVPRELLVIENGELHRLFTPPAGGTISMQDKDLVFNGQIVWGYLDGQSSEDFLKYWRERADEKGYSLSVKTLLCPKELSYFLK